MSEQQYPATAARQYPRAYFAAPIYLAARVVTLSGGTLGVAIERHTGLYRELIGTAALAAFPLHVLEGVGPLDAFYDEVPPVGVT